MQYVDKKLLQPLDITDENKQYMGIIQLITNLTEFNILYRHHIAWLLVYNDEAAKGNSRGPFCLAKFSKECLTASWDL